MLYAKAFRSKWSPGPPDGAAHSGQVSVTTTVTVAPGAPHRPCRCNISCVTALLQEYTAVLQQCIACTMHPALQQWYSNTLQNSASCVHMQQAGKNRSKRQTMHLTAEASRKHQ